MLSEEEKIRELELMLECYTGLPTEEDIEEYNRLQLKKAKLFLEKHGGKAYAVCINISQPYRPKPLFEISKIEHINFDALISPNVSKDKLERLEKLILQWNYDLDRKALDEIFKLLGELGAEFVDCY